MAFPALDCSSFQEAEAVAGPRDYLCRVDLSRARWPAQPKFLPTCEKTFIAGSVLAARDIRPQWARDSHAIPGGHRMKPLPSTMYYYARLTVWITSFLCCGPSVWASDVPLPRVSSAAAQTASSAPSTSQTAPGSEEKTEKSGKYDVDRIGQRRIGKGVNLY